MGHRDCTAEGSTAVPRSSWGSIIHPLRVAFVERLISVARRLDLTLRPQQEEQFRRYLIELVDWNQRVNLTAITEPEQVETAHFLDSVTVAVALPQALRSGGSLLDVGTGAGFPGVPLKILFPAMELTLVESVAKKTAFLRHLIDVLKLRGVAVCPDRAERLAHDATLRESFDAVTSRAVGSLRVLAELTLPFCRLGGRAILQKKGEFSNELRDAGPAFEKLGGRLLELQAIPREVLGGERVLVVIEKVQPTPARYPRREGIPAKRPL